MGNYNAPVYVNQKFILTAGLILAAMLAGYLCRKRAWCEERLAEPLMTAVAVVGYSLVGLLSVWVTPLSGADLWLPALAALHVAVMIVVGSAIARRLTKDPGKAGIFTISTALGNTGFTMGGFVCYLLYSGKLGAGGMDMGDEALGKVSILGLMWTPMVVLVLYPVARYYAGKAERQRGQAPISAKDAEIGVSPLRLLVQSLLDYRSIGLPMVLVGVGLSIWHVPRPMWVDHLHVMDILMFAIGVVAYFSIGLRLHLSSTWSLRGMVAALAGTRFLIGAALGAALLAIPALTAWPLESALSRNVFLLESFVPTAVTSVAIANMFSLRPREGSILFVTNTVLYVVLVLPVVAWLMG